MTENGGFAETDVWGAVERADRRWVSRRRHGSPHRALRAA